MLSKKWCYKLSSRQDNYSAFEVTYAISRRQAEYILKKRLKIKNVFVIIPCVLIEEQLKDRK